MKKNFSFSVVLFIVLLLTLTGCDGERNQLIKGFFYTATPIPPTATATLEPTPLPTPFPTPQPDNKVDTADHYLILGDFDNARKEYEAALDHSPTEALYAAAMVGLARVDALEKDYQSCQDRMIEALNQIQAEENKAASWYQMAECLSALELPNEEINALQEFLKVHPDSTLEYEVLERIADGQFSLQEYAAAREVYQQIVEGKDMNAYGWIWMKIADTYSMESDYTNAIQTWLNLLAVSSDDAQKARIDYLLAQTYIEINSPEQANARYQDAVNNYPRYYDSYAALLALIQQNQPVNEFQRGLVNYYRSQYALSSEAFYRYMAQEPGHDGTAWYYIGLCQMFLADYEKSIEAFSHVIYEYPENRFYTDAWDEKAYVEWVYLENFTLGSQTLLDYVKKHPDLDDAPKFLFEAGRILERGDRLTEAANQWERLIDEYPLYDQSVQALFLSGICRYRTKNYDAALATFNRLLLVSSGNADVARAHFWIAKVFEKKGESGSAKQNYELAAKDSPTDYYTERAKDILSDKDPLVFSENYSLETNLDQARAIAEQWMRLTFSLPDEVLLDQPEALLLDADYRKANEYWELGQYQQALNVFNVVRANYADDAVNSFRLLNRLVALGAWRPAVYTSRQILTKAGLVEDERTLTVPNYFNWIRYGTWYNESVLEASEAYAIHPFILYALMRQESMYDPWIWSSAGASGLMQIMPATGQEIAKKLRWPQDYTDDDLLRAIVAIRFSGSYLATQHSYFDKDNFFMLSSYNAGPGNTAGWVKLADDDPDLFVELIRFEETRTYIRHVYEFAKMYERFYSTDPVPAE